MKTETLLTTFDAAKILEVSPATVRLWNRLGKIAAMRTQGGMRLFTRTDVESLAMRRAANNKVTNNKEEQ